MGNRETIPDVDVEFELTLDFNSVDPIEMVKDDESKNWEFRGMRPTGMQTRRFKLVSVGYQPNLDAVREALKPHGSVPEGQWRESFKKAYPKPDGKGPIGFADPSWVSPDDYHNFPCLFVSGDQWNSDFSWSDFVGDVPWRWLVACPSR